MNREQTKTYPYIFGIFICAAVFVFPIWLYGIPLSHDTPHHFRTANALYEMISTGDFLPIWSENQNNGYGGIVLRIYPPLSYSVLAIGRVLAGNWYLGACLSFFFWSFIGGLGIFLWAKEWFSEKSAFAASIIFIFAPYHAIQLYSAFIYAEFAAVSLLPFVFLFATRLSKNANLQNTILLGFAYALLVLTHIPLTLIGSISLFGFFLLCPKTYSSKKSLTVFISAILIGLLLSCFHWIRVLNEMSFVGISTERFSAQNFYDYRENFLFSFPYLNGLDADIHQLWFMDMSLAVTLLLVVSFGILFYRKSNRTEKNNLRGIFGTSLFSFFMLTLLSYPLWNVLALLQKVQFPWRWFGVFSTVAVIFIAAGFEHLPSPKFEKNRPLFLIFCGFLFIGVSFTFSQIIRQAIFLNEKEFAAIVQNAVKEPDFEEWLPIWANKETIKATERIKAERNFKIIEWNKSEKSFKISAGNETEARIAQFYYPFWYAKINGADAEIKSANDGAILIKIPANEAIVSLEFVEPNSTRISFIISLLTFILSLSVYFWTKFKFTKIL